MGQPMMGQSMMQQMMQPDINEQNVQFQAFNPVMNPALQQENIDLIMDVPMEVSVVLGRTRKSIKEILEFAPGTIIELDKLAGEPIDVMVNQKLVAKGEVVVIEESFGIRITEIIKEKIESIEERREADKEIIDDYLRIADTEFVKYINSLLEMLDSDTFSTEEKVILLIYLCIIE